MPNLFEIRQMFENCADGLATGRVMPRSGPGITLLKRDIHLQFVEILKLIIGSANPSYKDIVRIDENPRWAKGNPYGQIIFRIKPEMWCNEFLEEIEPVFVSIREKDNIRIQAKLSESQHSITMIYVPKTLYESLNAIVKRNPSIGDQAIPRLNRLYHLTEQYHLPKDFKFQ